MATVAVKFQGSDEGARLTAEAVAASLDKLGLSANSVKFDVAQKGSDNLYSSLRTLKGEAVQHERVFGFFGRQLAETGLIARETASAFVGLGAGLASGMWFLAAAEAVKLLVQALRDTDKEAETTAKALGRISDQVERLRNQRLNILPETLTRGRIEVAEQALAKLAKARADMARAEEQYDSAAQGDAQARIKQYESLVAEMEKFAQVGKGDLQAWIDAQKALLGEERGATAKKAAKDEADAWKRYQDQVTASGIKAAEEEIRAEAKLREDDRRKEEAELRAWQKEMERIEGPEAQRKGEAALQEYERNRAIEQTHELAQAGSLAASAFADIGTALGGSLGKMTSLFGKLIQQAIQLAIAISAQGGPFAWLNIAAAAAAIVATVASVPKYEFGTPYVPQTGLALVHQGERIIPAAENVAGGLGGIRLTFNAPVDRNWWDQNQGHILRVLRDAAGNRRTS